MMKMKCLGILIGFVAFLPLATIASPKVLPQLGVAGLELIGKLRAQGTNRIGALDLGDLERTAKRVEWHYFSSKNPPAFAEGRRSAYFLRKEQEIYVAEELFDLFADELEGDALGVLELHEIASVDNKSDLKYEMTTALALLSRMPKGTLRDYLTNLFAKEFFSEAGMRWSGGSGSSVGGGGDLIPLIAKIRALELILQNGVTAGRRITPRFLAEYPRLAFEPFYEKNQQFVGMQYRVLPVERRGGKLTKAQDEIRIYIPVLEWRKGARAQKKILATVLENVTSLYPVFKDSPMTDVAGLTCSSKKTLRFPQPKNATIQTIQQARAAVLLGCQESMYVAEIRTPSFVTDEDKRIETERLKPKKSVVAHDCTLTLGDRAYPFQADLKSVRGEAHAVAFATASSTRPGQEIADSLVMVYVVGNEKGEIQSMMSQESQPQIRDPKTNSSRILWKDSKEFGALEKLFWKRKSASGESFKVVCAKARAR